MGKLKQSVEIELTDKYHVKIDKLNKALCAKSDKNNNYIPFAWFNKWSSLIHRLIKEITIDKASMKKEVIPWIGYYKIVKQSELEVQEIIKKIDEIIL